MSPFKASGSRAPPPTPSRPEFLAEGLSCACLQWKLAGFIFLIPHQPSEVNSQPWQSMERIFLEQHVSALQNPSSLETIMTTLLGRALWCILTLFLADMLTWEPGRLPKGMGDSQLPFGAQSGLT